MVLYFKQVMWQKCNKIGFEPVLQVSDVSPEMTTKAIRCKYRGRGFSLVELLAVMAVIAVMSALLVPSIAGFSSSAGRRGAVTTVMNVFEQARVAALESGRSVYVVFSRPDYPDQDAVMVVRETEDGTGQYEPLSRWIKLPKGVLLHSPAVGDSVLSATNPSTLVFDPARLPVAPPSSASAGLKVMIFNDQGALAFPTAKVNRKLIISEGIRGAGGTEAIISDKKQSSGGFEIISIAQYTGRAQLDVTTLH